MNSCVLIFWQLKREARKILVASALLPVFDFRDLHECTSTMFSHVGLTHEEHTCESLCSLSCFRTWLVDKMLYILSHSLWLRFVSDLKPLTHRYTLYRFRFFYSSFILTVPDPVLLSYKWFHRLHVSIIMLAQRTHAVPSRTEIGEKAFMFSNHAC